MDLGPTFENKETQTEGTNDQITELEKKSNKKRYRTQKLYRWNQNKDKTTKTFLYVHINWKQQNNAPKPNHQNDLKNLKGTERSCTGIQRKPETWSEQQLQKHLKNTGK